MKPRFSISTLLICMAVLAVVCAICARIKVDDRGPAQQGTMRAKFNAPVKIRREPTLYEALERMVWSAPLAVATTVMLLSLSRKLKRRRQLRGLSGRAFQPAK
jgi:hypothetical protein